MRPLLGPDGRPARPDPEYTDAASVRKPSGGIVLDGVHVADTVQCCHCGGHFVMRAGSGITRGWCSRCSGMICGPTCAECTPIEMRIEIAQKTGRSLGT